ncbi:hypothetical protein [Dysgonomonas sp. 520]|uniref:hypothetical protein n=1 Tax=Dysgonomonas sp. 520 TaxID=2302931 RepID=UPI0013D14DBC|nr:hypothetical protein [Dysgonomonas sp. 520]
MVNKLLVYLLFLVAAASCGKSVEEEAKEAAGLTKLSLEYSKKLDLDSSEMTFLQAKEIMDRYKLKEDSIKFESLYKKYLDENLTTEKQ